MDWKQSTREIKVVTPFTIKLRSSVLKSVRFGDFPGGPVVKNPPASAKVRG